MGPYAFFWAENGLDLIAEALWSRWDTSRLLQRSKTSKGVPDFGVEELGRLHLPSCLQRLRAKG